MQLAHPHSAPRAALARGVLSVLVLLALLAPVAPAQGRRTFHPADELEQWERFYLPDPPELGVVFTPELREFASRAGRRVGPTELEELRRRWEAVRPRLEDVERRFHDDARFRAEVRARYRVTKFRPFREIEPEILTDHEPFLLVLQRTGDLRKDLTKHEVERYVAHGRAAIERFREWVLTPLGRSFDPDRALFVLAVLADRRRYLEYANALREPGLYLSRAHYDPQRRFAVTFPTRENYDPEGYHALCHELVHAAMHAARSAAGSSRDIWLNEGLAEFLASGLARAPKRSKAVEARAILRTIAADPERRAMILPLEDLVAARHYGDVLGRIGRRLGGRVASAAALAVFYAEAHLFCEFLHDGGDGKYRQRLLAVIDANLSGKEGLRAFREAFGGIDLEVLQGEFLAWIDPSLAGVVLEPTPSLEEVTVADAAARGEAPPCGDPDPEALRDRLARADVALPLALAACAEGRPEDALEILDAALEKTPEGEGRERLRRAGLRVRAWIGLRDRFLALLLEKGGRLDVEVAGERISGKVRALEAGELVLETRRDGERRIAVDRVPAFQLASAMGRHRAELEAGWERVYPYALEGNPKWRRLLHPDESPPARSLLEEGEALAELVARGQALAPLADLAGTELPTDPDGAAAVLEALEAAFAQAGDALPADVPALLRPLACAALEIYYAEREPLDALAGTLEPLDGGRVRIRYEFSDPEEEGDFLPCEDPTGALAALLDARPTEGGGRMRDGALVLGGSGARRHRLAFTGPLTLRYRLEPRGEGAAVFAVGVRGTGSGRCVLAVCGKDLWILDAPSGLMPSELRIDPEFDEPRELELRFDGEGRVELNVGGRRVQEASCGSLRVLEPCFVSGSAVEIAVERFEIEGTPTEESLRPLARRAIAKRLAALGMASADAHGVPAGEDR